MSAIFDEDSLSTKGNHENVGRLNSIQDATSSILFTDVDTANRDLVVDIAKEICKKHCAKHLEIVPMRIPGDGQQVNRYGYHFFNIVNFFSLISCICLF